MIPLIFATVLNIGYPTYSDLPLRTEWESLGENIEYEVQYSFYEDYRYIDISRPRTTNTYDFTEYLEDRFYCRRLRYRYLGKQDFYYKNLDCFYFQREYIPPPPEETVVEIPTVVQPEQHVNEDISLDIYEGENIFQEEEIKGVEDSSISVCNISILKKDVYTLQVFDCDLGISISNTTYLDWNTYFSLSTEGIYKNNISAQVSIFECKAFSLLDPNTWGKCKQILIEKKQRNLELIYSGNVNVDGVFQRNSSFVFSDSSFFTKTVFKKDIASQKLSFVLNTYISFKRDLWIDLMYTRKIPLNIQKAIPAVKPFSFPLDRYIGVTQWYGCTDYQCPHKGIDFGARLNRVLSIGDGTVVNVGYDRYGGECNQGGNFVILKHTHGMHSTYFHLNSYNVKVGDIVKKGGVLGISGNSGKWNCQNLGYHLHFETRKGSSSSTHTNPVEYIDVDWNIIPTIGKDVYPKRLSGENPHPNF